MSPLATLSAFSSRRLARSLRPIHGISNPYLVSPGWVGQVRLCSHHACSVSGSACRRSAGEFARHSVRAGQHRERFPFNAESSPRSNWSWSWAHRPHDSLPKPSFPPLTAQITPRGTAQLASSGAASAVVRVSSPLPVSPAVLAGPWGGSQRLLDYQPALSNASATHPLADIRGEAPFAFL